MPNRFLTVSREVKGGYLDSSVNEREVGGRACKKSGELSIWQVDRIQASELGCELTILRGCSWRHDIWLHPNRDPVAVVRVGIGYPCCLHSAIVWPQLPNAHFMPTRVYPTLYFKDAMLQVSACLCCTLLHQSKVPEFAHCIANQQKSVGHHRGMHHVDNHVKIRCCCLDV